jgi:mono/diheme cytochrome c family protein
MRYAISLVVAFSLAVANVSLAADGAAIFKQHCASCHGETGKADTAAGKAMKVPPLAGDAKVAGMSDADITATIKGNAKHAAVLKKVTDADIAAVAAHVKGLAAAK